MDRIPYQRYHGHREAWGRYGLPTVELGRISGMQLALIGIVAVMFGLYAAGIIDLPQAGIGGILLGAGPTVTELGDDVEKRQNALKAFMDEHKTDKTDDSGRPLYDLDAEGVKKVREMNGDLDKAVATWKAAKADDDEITRAHAAANAGLKSDGRLVSDSARIEDARPSNALMARARLKALLDESIESGGIKATREAIASGRKKIEEVLFTIDDVDEADALIDGVKATITLADITPQATRLPSIVESAQNRIVVSDLMAPGTMDGNTISYYEETTFTNAAVETAEGVAKPESTLDFTERTETARKIPTWIPITDEALNDNRQLRSYVEGRLLFMVRQREEQQLIVGDGTPPNISGILDRSGIQTQAKGADPVPDAFFKAFTKVQVTGDADPSGFVIHPNDWQDVRLLRTADGIYIFGAPNDEVQVRMWGYPGRVTTGITENTGLVGAFRTMSQVFRREGLRVIASTEHASFFVENKVALLAETRLALAVYRPAAFCQVTGI